MGNSAEKYTLIHGHPIQWKDSASSIFSWSDCDDDIIETRRAPQNTYGGHPIFKLQQRLIFKSAKIVVRNYESLVQATIMRADSKEDARLGYQYLVNMVLDEHDLTNPETVISALERLQTLPGTRFENLTHVHGDLFPELLLQPLEPRWNPKDFHADIILVHGLGGDSKTTWLNHIGTWPIVWLLDAQSGIRSMIGRYDIRDLPIPNKIRVLTVAHRCDMFNNAHDTDPRLIAHRLVELLAHAGVGSKPIVWIAHSLGGLIVKEVLYATRHGFRRDIFALTKGVVFFGTPHCGATWASTMRQADSMHNSAGLKYLDPSPSVGADGGNSDRLRKLNEFFSQTAVSFLNFSEGSPCSPAFLFPLASIVIVPDAQAHITGSVTASAEQQAEEMSMGRIPPRVHYPCLDCHHFNIARPMNLDHATFRLTKTYIAYWLQYPITVTNNTECEDWNSFVRSIVSSVRMYSLVIERITNENRTRLLTDVSAALGLVLSTMTVMEFLILIAFLSGALIATGAGVVGAGVILGGPIGLAVSSVGMVAAAASGGVLVSRLAPRVRALLTDNSAVIREMVNVISRYVRPDYRDIISGARSQQELEGTLNRLQRTTAQTMCSVFLEPAEPQETLKKTDAIRSAVETHRHCVRQAEIVINYVSQVMHGVTSIDSDETEQLAKSNFNT